MELNNLTIKKCHEGLKKREFSSVELTKAHLEKIKQTDKELNAFLSVFEDSALAEAESADAAFAKGYGAQDKKISMLTGVPCSVKDAILVEGQKCTAGSRILENYKAPYDATVIKKLKEHGSVILGKNNLDEFTMGGSGENSAFGPTKNPHDKTRVAGGSSSGSAGAVAANQAVFSLGSDTGGSIRQPACFCGIVGLSPTYGAVSRYGLIAHASSLDQIGPLAKSVEDAEIIFDAISGKDLLDATSVEYKYEQAKNSKQPVVIGVPKEYFKKGLDFEVEEIIKNAIKKAEDQGFKIKEISLPSTEYALACYYIVGPSEISANLARFDGIRYGLSQQEGDLSNVYLKSRGKGFGAEPKRRIMIGTYCLSSGYYDAYYKKAQEVRELIKQDFKKAFSAKGGSASGGGVDLLFCPVSPFPAFKIGEKAGDPLSMYLADIYTVAVKLAGVPALSLPAGRTKGNLPVGLQIIGNHFEENKIFSIASQLEEVLK